MDSIRYKTYNINNRGYTGRVVIYSSGVGCSSRLKLKIYNDFAIKNKGHTRGEKNYFINTYPTKPTDCFGRGPRMAFIGVPI